ncbi:MAG: penicillin-binding protein activator, partial [Pseudomonadota bacterium]
MHRVVFHLALTFAACATVSPGQIAASSSSGDAKDGAAPGDARGPSADGDGAITGRTPSSTAGNPGADADFAAARARFDSGDQEGARAALEAFVSRNSSHPSRPAAEILLARLALGRGEPAEAKGHLEPVIAAAAATADAGAPRGNETPARYYLGLAELRLGNTARARALLLPYLPKGGADAPLDGTDDAAVELRAALAEATAPTDPVAALELWEAYARAAREHEKAWARGRAAEIGARVAPEVAWRAYGAARPSGLTRAVLGAKAAIHLRSRGDANGAAFIEAETAAARTAQGFNVATARVGPGDPTRIGLAIPLSGKFQVVGEAVLRAAMLATGNPAAAANAPGATQLLVRDTATEAERAARGVAELTRAEAAIGIVGATSAKTGAGAAAISQATEDGIAMLALDDTAPGALTTAFQIVPAPEARAAALARQALKLGVRKFGLLGPDSSVGKRLRDAFRKAVIDGGGTIAAESTYVAGATSFTTGIAPLRKAGIEAIFVPDNAERLALIAPALAVADLWPQPWNKPRAPVAAPPAKGQKAGGQAGGSSAAPRPVLLLSTANELSGKLVETVGRYVQGALLCPGFFAGDGDPRARAFVDAYRAAYGQEPHATEAYAYDAVSTLRAVTQRGARTRPEVVKALGAGGGGGAP